MSKCILNAVNASSLKMLQYRPMVYVGEIGMLQSYRHHIVPRQNKQVDILLHDTPGSIPLYKYGITSNIYRRVYKEHVKNFSTFDLKVLKESYRNKYVESVLTRELKQKNMLLELRDPCRKQVIRELFCFTDPDTQFPWFMDLLDDTIHQSWRIDTIWDWDNFMTIEK